MLEMIKPKIILLKGEKIIAIRASKRAKAHKRKIKIGDKKRIKESSLKRVIEFYESTIKDQDFESCGAFSDDGSIVFQKDGEKDRVIFNKKEESLCEGATFTHNHPSGLPFSPTDIKFTCKNKLKEMRVIGSSGKHFILKTTDGTNFNFDMWTNLILPKYKVADSDVHNSFINAINDKKMTIKEANEKHFFKVWEKVFNSTPNIIYEVK
jgi:hypothetical protein